MVSYLYEPCIDLIIHVLERAISDWHKTCSLDPTHSQRVLAALKEHTGGVSDICEFCKPHGGPFRELSCFFASEWCEFLFGYTPVHRDTAVKHLKIITRRPTT